MKLRNSGRRAPVHMLTPCAVAIAPGGTFALYAQLRRQGTKAARGGAKDGAQRVKAADWRQRLIESRKSQNVLRVLVVLGVGAIMGDGVLTPVSCFPVLAQHLNCATSVRHDALCLQQHSLCVPCTHHTVAHTAPMLPPYRLRMCRSLQAVSVVSACEGLTVATSSVTRSA